MSGLSRCFRSSLVKHDITSVSVPCCCSSHSTRMYYDNCDIYDTWRISALFGQAPSMTRPWYGRPSRDTDTRLLCGTGPIGHGCQWDPPATGLPASPLPALSSPRFCRKFANPRALPSAVLGPVLKPPCMRHRPFRGRSCSLSQTASARQA